MHCPVCSHADTRVIDTRLSQDGTSIRRRRQCDECSYRFTTGEEIELLTVMVVKRDGSQQPYSREKLVRGLKSSLEKRPYVESAFRTLVHDIERDILRLDGHEVRSSDIGEIVMKHLQGFDKVAFIRFASVYRQFEDVKTFQETLDRLTEAAKQRKKRPL